MERVGVDPLIESDKVMNNNYESKKYDTEIWRGLLLILGNSPVFYSDFSWVKRKVLM